MRDLLALTGRKKDKLVQKVLDYEKAKGLQWPMLGSQKIDGVFCMAFHFPEGVTIYSRTGEVYKSLQHLEKEFEKVIPEGFLFIFEAALLHGNKQSKVSGACRDTKNQHPEICGFCHDAMRIDEFVEDAAEWPTPRFDSRNSLVKQLLEAGKPTSLYYLPQDLIFSMSDALEFAKRVWAEGGEGVVLRDPNAPYQPGKRNSSQVRIKQSETHDLLVVGMNEGTGKYKGTLGTIVCRWKEGATIKASGMSDKQRRDWWADPELIVGKIVEVKAMRDSSKGVLREPRFKGIRYDKAEADY